MERFTMFRSYYESLKECPPDVRLEVYDAMMQYAFDGIEPEFKNQFSKAIWVLVLPVMKNSLKQGINGSQPKHTEKVEPPAENREEQEENQISRIDYNEVKNLWNNICGLSNGSIRILSASRKNKVKSRIEEIKRNNPNADYMEILRDIFTKVSKSPFLQGYNQRQWKANFDWIFENDSNYLKVLENRYVTNITQQQYGSRHLQDRATEEQFYRKQSDIASQFFIQDGDAGIVDTMEDN